MLNIPGWKECNILTQRNPTVKFLVWNPWHVSDFKSHWSLSIPSAIVRYSLKFPLVHWCYCDTTDSILFILRKTSIILTKKHISPCSLLLWKILPDILLFQWHEQIRHCLLAIIIKWCHMITWGRRQSRHGRL